MPSMAVPGDPLGCQVLATRFSPLWVKKVEGPGLRIQPGSLLAVSVGRCAFRNLLIDLKGRTDRRL